MTHDEARELFTARIDDVLEADERARLERHLGGCLECRRELDRLERAVALLRDARPVHAPAGFAERVVAAARPPRRRLAQALFRPLPVKLPLHAAAVLLVAITATWLLRTPPAPHEAERPALAAKDRTATPASEPPTAAPRKGLQDSRERSDAAGAPAQRDAGPRAKAEHPAVPSPERAVRLRTEADTAHGVVVAAAWTASDRAVAVRDLEVLVTEMGGTLLSRREDADAAVVEVWLPDGAWAAVARELERRGRLHVDGEPAAPGPVRATVRISG